jgi:hypothetical protein
MQFDYDNKVVGYLCKLLKSGANPTIASYNASVVKFYNATNSVARFKNKKYFSPI